MCVTEGVRGVHFQHTISTLNYHPFGLPFNKYHSAESDWRKRERGVIALAGRRQCRPKVIYERFTERELQNDHLIVIDFVLTPDYCREYGTSYEISRLELYFQARFEHTNPDFEKSGEFLSNLSPDHCYRS